MFNRIPTASNSISSSLFCSADLVASTEVCQLGHRPDFARRPTHQNDQVCGFGDGNDLPSTSTAYVSAQIFPHHHKEADVPFAASCTIPGRSRSWILAPSYSRTPGMAYSCQRLSSFPGFPLRTVNVVNSYAPIADSVLVVFDSNVDLPTDGNPIKHTRASALISSRVD